MASTGSTLLLTLLLAVGLVFFLRAASKDRTTVVDVRSSKPAIEVLSGLTVWLEQRGWQAVPEASDPERRHLLFRAQVAASPTLAVLLSLLGGVGASCLGLVLRQLAPALGWWPLLLALLGPMAGVIYRKRAQRAEELELRLLSHDSATGSELRLRAHRDELIALEQDMGPKLGLFSDGSLLSSPI
ncbi:cofactor assembly of complex C subunit B [Synechococcus sp. FGCU-3]|nr:cofactor assembly of complex C subunit B [Synechococcus sp. FGCU3]